MKKIIILMVLAIKASLLFAQVTLTIEGTTVNNSETGTWSGVYIQRSAPTILTYKNNSITSVNSSGYMLQAGDDNPNANSHNLDGEIITGNKLVWNGANFAFVDTHGIMTGYNINAVVKYNYLSRVPMSIIRKSNGMTNTSGGVAYNIINKTGLVGTVIKGMNNVRIYNNTYYSNEVAYSGQNAPGTWRGLIDIYTNTDPDGNNAPSTGVKIKNNIFYTVNQIYNIFIYEAECLPGFESDYNVFYCESGTPKFNYLGTVKTFAEWQALGYDTHSVVINPNFIDFTGLVPRNGLYVGIDLGAEFRKGLATNATWITGSDPATIDQGSTWQVGAYIYGSSAVSPNYISSVIENNTPAILEMTYSQSLANVLPSVSAFSVQVNSVTRAVNSLSVAGSKVRLTLASPVSFGDNITVAYSKPANNPLQTSTGEQAASITSQPVVNNRINIYPAVVITSPGNGISFTAPATITIIANATDADGTVSKVEFYNGSAKLGEKSSAPYSFSWNNITVGTYSLTAVATDNFNARTTSAPVSIVVNNSVPLPNKPPAVSILTPYNASTFKAPATVTITAAASDPDGTISKVEFFRGTEKLAEILTAPYSFTLSNLNSGNYSLTAIATDNANATSASTLISFAVNPEEESNSELIKLYPNPNSGKFTVEISGIARIENTKISIVNSSGKKVYEDTLLREEMSKQFDLSYLSPGIYILLIFGRKIIVTKEFIKV